MHACSTIALVLALSGNHAAQTQEVTQDSGIQSILERSGDNFAFVPYTEIHIALAFIWNAAPGGCSKTPSR